MDNKQQQIEWTKSFKNDEYQYTVEFQHHEDAPEGAVILLHQCVGRVGYDDTIALYKSDARKIIELLQEAVK